MSISEKYWSKKWRNISIMWWKSWKLCGNIYIKENMYLWFMYGWWGKMCPTPKKRRNIPIISNVAFPHHQNNENSHCRFSFFRETECFIWHSEHNRFTWSIIIYEFAVIIHMAYSPGILKWYASISLKPVTKQDNLPQFIMHKSEPLLKEISVCNSDAFISL